jgi:hypothetical protein
MGSGTDVLLSTSRKVSGGSCPSPDDDLRAYWKEAERCWLALAQHGEARPWPFVSKETEKSD